MNYLKPLLFQQVYLPLAFLLSHITIIIIVMVLGIKMVITISNNIMTALVIITVTTTVLAVTMVAIMEQCNIQRQFRQLSQMRP